MTVVMTRPPRERKERAVSFRRLTIADVETLVGRKADGVKIRGSWVVLYFAAPDVTVRFRKW